MTQSNNLSDVIFVASPQKIEELFKKKCPKLAKNTLTQEKGFLADWNQKVNERSIKTFGLLGAGINKLIKANKESRNLLEHADEISSQLLEYVNKQPVHSNLVEYTNEEKANFVLKSMQVPTEVKYISLEDARKLKFSKGEKPTENSFFVKHPYISDFYIRPETYQIQLAKAKETVFTQLAMALGASKIRMLNISTQTSNKKIKTSVPLIQYGLLTNLGVTFDAVTKEYCSKELTFNQPDRLPDIPEHLREWVDQDMDLQTMYEGRKNGQQQKTHRVALQYFNETKGGVQITGSLLNILNQEFDAKIMQEKFEATTLLFEIDYH